MLQQVKALRILARLAVEVEALEAVAVAYRH